MADAWPASKSVTSLSFGGYSLSKRLSFFVLIAPVAPLLGISLILNQMFTTLSFRIILSRLANSEPEAHTMCYKLRRLRRDILVIIGINQKKDFLRETRFIATTSVVLGISKSATLSPEYIDMKYGRGEVANIDDALILGDSTAENLRLVKLRRAGKLALLESRILPNYKHLRFVDGRSGKATIIIFVQAIGYVASTVYRAILHLPVSPIEAIGFAFTVLVIVHSLLHCLGVICQNPLVIYLNPKQERKMLEKCQSTPRWSDANIADCENVATVGMVVVGSVVVAFTIFVEWHVLRISSLDAIGPILFLLSFITQSFSHIILPRIKHLSSKRKFLFLYGSVMISFFGIVVSIVATIVNWQTDKFDTRTPALIRNFPFLG